jgi:hypothetical protein
MQAALARDSQLLAPLLNAAQLESLDDVPSGRNQLLVRCVEGKYKGRFFYVNPNVRDMQNQGETLGSEETTQPPLTMVIAGAGLSSRHCKIWMDAETGCYLVKDLGSDTGTWVKVRRELPVGEPTFPGSEIVLGRYEFRVEVVSDTGSSGQRLRFSSNTAHFEVGDNEVSIGSDPGCEVALAGLLPLHAKVACRQGLYFTINSSDGDVFKKLRTNEVAQLQPGSVFKVGQLLFEACRYHVGRWAEKGARDTMEDTDTEVHNLYVFDELHAAFYAIFDGHGGSQCASFLKSNLCASFRRHLLAKSTLLSAHFPQAISEAFEDSYAETDRAFYESDREVGRGVGSTAVACVIVGGRVVCSNLGDSRAVLCRAGTAIDLSVDHKAVSLT